MTLDGQYMVSAGGEAPPAQIRVWDLLVRSFHWSLVAGVTVSWLASEEWDRLHEWSGYLAVGLVTARVLWGFVGSPHARFSDFVRPPGAVISYLGDMLRGREARHIGHNPAGGMMVIALIATILGLGLSGWMMTLEPYANADLIEEGHEVLANFLLVQVLVHIAGVLIAGLRHGENLVRAMITGNKRASP